MQPTFTMKSSKRHDSSSGTSSGAVDEDLFTKSFEDVSCVKIFSAKEASDRFSKIRDTLSDSSNDWEKRISALKEIRGLILAGANDHIDVVQQLRSLDPGFQLSVKDLRSQVVREACITVAFLAMRLGLKFEFSAESLMPILIGLIQNSAKVMSSSAIVAIRFIVQKTHAPRLIPAIVAHVSSKSNIIRRQCFEFLDILLHLWPRQSLERHLSILQEAIKQGLSDADSDARMYSRRAFCGFADHFREQAFALVNMFSGSKQQQILAELGDPNMFHDLKKPRARSTDRTDSRSSDLSSRRSSESGNVSMPSTPDLIPIQKHLTSVSRKNSLKGHVDASSRFRRVNAPVSGDPTRRSRTASKIGVSQSQPGSRSGSPSSRLTPLTNLQPDVAESSKHSVSTLGRTRPKRMVVHSQGSSREGSPDRRLGHGFKLGVQQLRQLSGRASPSPQKSSLTLQCMAEYGKDLEAHISDALRQRSTHYRSEDGSDAASETSSVCSENSFKSGSDMISDDVSDAMVYLASGSWAERREGLVMIQRLLRSNKKLSPFELKKVTEIFTRMFHDPHSKVMSVFLETFVDFVSAHSCDLVDWFQISLTRLLGKAGSDVLGSMQSRISRALDALRDSFPHQHQFVCVMRFIVEQTQIPNVKVKLVLLNYLQGLICHMEPSCFSNSSDTRLAVSRIITWTSEPKSPEVRKSAQIVLIALMHLNSSELTMIISVLPKSFQEGASKVLSGAQPVSPSELARLQMSKGSYVSSTPSNASRLGSRSRPSLDSNEGNEDFSAEDIYNGIKKASEDIQHLSMLGQKLDTSYAKAPLPEQENSIPRDILVVNDSIEKLLSELSNSVNSLDERLKALTSLVPFVRHCQSDEIWDVHFKMVLLLLLELMRDPNSKLRTNSLIALKELLDYQSSRFSVYAELTILSLLEFERDTEREVLRAADDCGGALAKAIATDQAIGILNPISLTADFPINLAAVKLETKVVQIASAFSIKALMPDMIPGLIKGFENSESSVRKASMLCLLSIYSWVGEDLMSQLATLHPSKMKLLNLYIKRAAEQKEGRTFDPSSPT